VKGGWQLPIDFTLSYPTPRSHSWMPANGSRSSKRGAFCCKAEWCEVNRSSYAALYEPREQQPRLMMLMLYVLVVLSAAVSHLFGECMIPSPNSKFPYALYAEHWSIDMEKYDKSIVLHLHPNRWFKSVHRTRTHARRKDFEVWSPSAMWKDEYKRVPEANADLFPPSSVRDAW
jgi:hypothetical protein